MKKLWVLVFLILGFVVVTDSHANLIDGLVVYYPLDGNAIDYSGNGYDGYQFMVTSTADRFGNNTGAQASNGDGYIEIPSAPFASLSQMSVAFWVKTTDIGAGNIYWNSPHLFGADVSGFTDNVFNIYTMSGRIGIWAELDNNFGDEVSLSSYFIADNKWHFIVATVNDENDEISLYVDTQKITSIAGGQALYERPYYLMASNPGQDNYEGSFDSLRIYNRIISNAEIQQLYLEPVPEPTTMLLLGTGLVGVAGAARRRKKNQA